MILPFCQFVLFLQAFPGIVSVLSHLSGAEPSPHAAADVAASPVDPQAGRRSVLRASSPAFIALLVAGGIALTVLGVLSDRPHGHLQLHLAWLAPAIVALTALELMQAGVWHRLLAALGGELELPDALAAWCVSAVARYVPTSMLMPVVRVRMCRDRRVVPEVCLASLVYEGVLVNCGAACVAAYFIVTLPALRGDQWRWTVLALPLISLGALHPRLLAPLSRRLLARMGRLQLPVHLSLRQLLGFTAFYVASFALAGVGLVAIVSMLHPLTWTQVPTVIGAMAIGFIASAFAFVLPGGLGAREAVLVLALSPVLPTVAATASAVATRLAQLGIELLFALLLPWMARRRRARRTAAKAQRA